MAMDFEFLQFGSENAARVAVNQPSGGLAGIVAGEKKLAIFPVGKLQTAKTQHHGASLAGMQSDSAWRESHDRGQGVVGMIQQLLKFPMGHQPGIDVAGLRDVYFFKDVGAGIPGEEL